MLSDESDIEQELQQFQVFIEYSKINQSLDKNKVQQAYSVVPLKDFAFEKDQAQEAQPEITSFVNSLRNNKQRQGRIRTWRRLQYMENLRLLIEKSKLKKYKKQIKNSKMQDKKQNKSSITERANHFLNENQVNTVTLVTLAKTDNDDHNDSIQSIQDISVPNKFYHYPKQKSLSNFNTTYKPLEKSLKLHLSTTFCKNMKNQPMLIDDQDKEENNFQDDQNLMFSFGQNTQRSQTQSIQLQGQTQILDQKYITNSNSNERVNAQRTKAKSISKLLNQDISNCYQPKQK